MDGGCGSGGLVFVDATAAWLGAVWFAFTLDGLSGGWGGDVRVVDGAFGGDSGVGFAFTFDGWWRRFGVGRGFGAGGGAMALKVRRTAAGSSVRGGGGAGGVGRGLLGEGDVGVFHHCFLDAVANGAVAGSRKETTRDVFGKTLLLVVRVADGHFEDGFLEALEFFLRVRLDQKSCPSFETHWC